MSFYTNVSERGLTFASHAFSKNEIQSQMITFLLKGGTHYATVQNDWVTFGDP